MPNPWAVPGFSFALSFTGTNCDSTAAATLGWLNTLRSNARHGPHSGVQKWTRTSRPVCRATALALSMSCIHWTPASAAAGNASNVLKTSPQRNCRWRGMGLPPLGPLVVVAGPRRSMAQTAHPSPVIGRCGMGLCAKCDDSTGRNEKTGSAPAGVGSRGRPAPIARRVSSGVRPSDRGSTASSRPLGPGLRAHRPTLPPPRGTRFPRRPADEDAPGHMPAADGVVRGRPPAPSRQPEMPPRSASFTRNRSTRSLTQADL